MIDRFDEDGGIFRKDGLKKANFYAIQLTGSFEVFEKREKRKDKGSF